MRKAKNKVIAGDYINKPITSSFGILAISGININTILIDKNTVENYELITEETSKSGTSAILRGGIGATILGPVGLLAAVSAKNKEIYNVAIQFKDGKKSLLEIDEKVYKLLVKKCF